MTQNKSKCCDKIAECNCGITTGHYTCLCPLGYFGSGLKGSCYPCANGTYGNIISPGDSLANCLSCPSANHITLKIPAISLNDCICALGFIKNGTNCEAVTCPKFRIPENGYLVKANACSNVVNAACGLRCRIGFRLIGDSIRLCSNNATWSGIETQCILKTCPTPRPPLHGRVHCEYDDESHSNPLKRSKLSIATLPIDARCQFKCNNGYQLLGSKLRNCLPVSRWDGLKVTCKQIKCEPLPQLANGFITPGICTGIKKLSFGTSCNFTCTSGFELNGPMRRRCIGSSGLWSQRHIISRCIDKTPPVIKCPNDSTWKTLPGKRYSLPTWMDPIASDNSDKFPHVWSKPHLAFPWKSKIGNHLITYIAEDTSGNRARCRFIVTTVDEEPPAIENCIDPPIYLSSLLVGAENVTWDEPDFHDNSGKKIIVQQSHFPGSFFPLGTTKIMYNATDESHNTASCVLNITVENICKDVPIISNSRTDCREFSDKNIQCAIICDEGYVFPIEESGADENLILNCNSNENNWNKTFFPSCSVSAIPSSVEFGGSIFLESNSTICHEQMILEHLKKYINNDLSKNFNDNCNENGIDCRLSKMYFDCKIMENETITVRHQRRSLNETQTKNKTRMKHRRDKIEVKFWFIGKIISDYQHDPRQGVQKLRQKIQKMTKSGQLNLLDEKTNREIGKLALNIQTIFSDELKEHCDAGSIFHRDKCVQCPPGTFYNLKKNYCSSCRLGEYQDKFGETSCKECPKETSTKKNRSVSVNNCIKLCKPGYYSKRKYHRDQIVSMEPCLSCDIGYYQPFYGERQCRPCPGNATTNARGVVNVKDCIYTQDSCTPSSCLNNGRCIRESSGYSCECPENYVGSRCEIRRNPCEIIPCLNGGICFFNEEKTSGYYCNCTSKFTGYNCEKYVDECISNPCKNNGTCYSNENDFNCKCTDNFAGEFCEIPQDLCSNICEEGSTCLIVDGTWRCICKPGYLGRRCQLLPCDWLPCHPNAICINIADVNTTHESYKCQCPVGYHGDDCLTRINHCRNSPCQNDGVCINNLSNYTCECSNLFDGFNCESKLSSEFVLHFVKPGTTDYVLLKNRLAIDITELTLCLWLQSMDTFNYGTVFSYATQNQDNAITLTDYNGFVFYINGFNVVTDISLNDGYWHFICATWQSVNGSWKIYVDGILKAGGQQLATNTVILGNGSVVIGQEQDYIEGGFSISEAFLGRLTLLDFWNTTLNEKSIKNLSQTCDNYHGNLITWANLKKYIYGDIKILESNFCHGCEIPIAPHHGHVNISEDLREATYSCEIGYNLRVGNQIYDSMMIKCMKQGKWNSNYNFKCIKVVCGFPRYFPRGKIHGNSYLYGDEIYYTCNEGYQLRGNPHRVCNSNRNWSGRPPICIGITCKSPLAPEHGDIEYIIEEHERDDVSILQVGQQLEFKCDSGYRLVGERILMCMKSGEWNHQIPLCQSIGCPPPTPLNHGHMNYKVNNTVNMSSSLADSYSNYYSDNSTMNYYKHEDVVTFSCNEGYKFQGNSTRSTFQMLKCFSNDSWIGSLTSCIPIKCPWPSVEHAIIVNKIEINSKYGAIPGTKLSITCKERFIVSDDNVTCNNYGDWFPAVPKCILHQCSPLSTHPVANLFVGKSITVSSLTKNKNNSVENDTLAQLTLAIGGDKFGDKFTLQCNDMTKKLNLMINNTNNLIINEISWQCDEKGIWKLIRDVNMTENQLRQYLLANDVCENNKSSCSPPMVPLNGYLIDTGENDGDNWQINDSITYKCRNGYKLHGSGIIFCTENGTWSPLQQCKLVNCIRPPTIIDAKFLLNTNESKIYEFGRVIQYICSSGYRLFGQGTIRCLASGNWSKMQGKCSRLSCGKPNINNEIMLVGNSYLYGEELSYNCPKNNLHGKIICKADGTWSNLPICNK